MNQPPQPIGTIESVSLPDYAIDNIPAKVDTGADSSAIWASNISENGGALKFTLFGPTSPYYSGTEIVTKRFTVVVVKNSFGHTEVRYKVTLKLKIADRIIKTRVSLANRSNNRFPILIGLRTLRGKFVVDVSRRNQNLGTNKMLMLVNEINDNNSAFAETLNQTGVQITSAKYADLIFRINADGNRISLEPQGNDISEFGLVYFRTSNLLGNSSLSAAVAKYLEARNADFIDRSVSQAPQPNKILQYVVLTDNGVPVPPTIFMLPNKLKNSYELLIAELGLPFILKDIAGRKGDNNYLINSKTDFVRAVNEAADLGVWLLAQQYIPNDCDYRLLTLGAQVALIIKRTAGSDTHLNNVSRGSKVDLVDIASLPADLVNKAAMAAKLFQLQIGGVDLVQDKVTKLWYCLEVNKSPQIYTGSFIDEKAAAIAKYFNQRLNS